MRKYWRFLTLGIIMLLTLTIVIVNVFVVTLGQYHSLSNTSLSPYVENLNIFTKEQLAKRGDILDRDGTVIATDSYSYNLYAILDENRMNGLVPAYVVDKEQTAIQLSEIINLSKESILSLLNRDVYQTEFGTAGRNLTLEQKEAIDALALPGLAFHESFNRYYPLGVFASNLIGLARFDENLNRVTGQWGLESLYEEELAGVNGSITYQQDLHGYFLDSTTISEVKEVDGSSIYLTLDQSIQEGLEAAFTSTLSQVEATNLFGSVMEIDTGKILAWGQSPSYDPNEIKETSEATFLNYGLQGSFEPGSTFKAFTYAAAIDSGSVSMNDLYDSNIFYVGVDDNGNLMRSQKPTGYGYIRNYEFWKDYGLLTYAEGFARSHNTSTAELVVKMGDERFYDYIKAFGFLESVNPDKFNDTPGYASYYYPIEIINSSFGQGITVSMIQMLQAYSAIMSDGTMVKPHFIDKIVNEQNEVTYQSQTEVVGTPIRNTTAKHIQDLMHDVVYADEGTARRYQVEGIDLIAKTGTSQVVIDGKYSDDQVITSVILGFPYDDPKILIYYGYQVDFDNIYDADVSGIKNLVHNLSLMYEENDNGVESSNEYFEVEMPQFTSHNLSYALTHANQLNIHLEVIGDGQVVKKQLPEGNSKTMNYQKMFVLTDGSTIKMPDMKNWTKKDVTNFASLVGIEVEFNGSGLVNEQSIAIGTILEQSSKLLIHLQ